MNCAPTDRALMRTCKFAWAALFLVIALLPVHSLARAASGAPMRERQVQDFLRPDGTVDLDAVRASGYEGPLTFDGPARINPTTGALRVGASTNSRGGGPRLDSGSDTQWSPAFAPPSTGVNGVVYAIAAYNGSLYVGGHFTTIGSTALSGIAQWDGVAWHAVGAFGPGQTITHMVVWNGYLVASGEDYLAGGFVDRWDGSAWSAMPGPYVEQGCIAPVGLVVFGGELVAVYPGPSDYLFCLPGKIVAYDSVSNHNEPYIGGTFDSLTAIAVYSGHLVVAGHVVGGGYAAARLDGTTWTILDKKFDHSISCLTSSPDGAYLYAGGAFTTYIGGPPNQDRHIIRWDGLQWTQVGGGVDCDVNALTFYNGLLYVGGCFNAPAGASRRVVAWDGANWLPVGAGIGASSSSDNVYALYGYSCSPDCGAVPQGLYAGGGFDQAAGAVVNNLAAWDGASWLPVHGGHGVTGVVNALSYYHGSLYAGGSFTQGGDVSANNVARWTGTIWEALSTGVDGTVRALTVYDDHLVAGGDFATAGGSPAAHVAQWDGLTWSALGAGTNGSVYALTVFDPNVFALGSSLDPTSAAQLIVGGYFTFAGGLVASYIAEWDGAVWQPLSTGMNGRVNALCSIRPNIWSPSDLIAGGTFTTAGGIVANYVARWDGAAWQPLGAGVTGAVAALLPGRTGALSGSGSGALLYVGGNFSTAGSGSADDIAAWTGTDWTSLASELDGPVEALAWLNGDLAVGGDFTLTQGGPAAHVATFGDAGWNSLASGTDAPVHALLADRVGRNLYVGGVFTNAGGKPSSYIAQWSTTVSAGQHYTYVPGMDGDVVTLLPYGATLIAAGAFAAAGSVHAKSIASWDGVTWSPLGNGLTDAVFALQSYNGALIAGGTFLGSGATSAKHVAKWDGASWQPLGVGISDSVFAFTVYNGALIAAGHFANAGGIAAQNIAQWDGAAWSPVGSGISGTVRALTVYNGLLVAGGDFSKAGGNAVAHIAGWDGAKWSAFGNGFDGSVFALATWGGTLVAAGGFSASGQSSVPGIASWSGLTWTGLGSGMDGPVYNLASYGSDLIASGQFAHAGGGASASLARWNGSKWSALDAGTDGAVAAAAEYNGALFLGGLFTAAGNAPASFVAAWNDSVLVTGVGQQERPGRVTLPTLSAAGPNPAWGRVALTYVTAVAGGVELAIFSATGVRMATLVQWRQPAGAHAATWDGRTARGARAPAGVYYARLEAGGAVRRHAVVLMR